MSRLAGVLVHLAAIDLETLAELDIGLGDDLLQQRLALEQWQGAKGTAVQVQQIERDQHDVFGSALEFVLQNREIGAAVGSRHDHLTVDDRRSGVDVPCVGRDLSEAVGPIIAAPSEYRDDGVSQMDLDTLTVELDFMDPSLTVWHGID